MFTRVLYALFVQRFEHFNVIALYKLNNIIIITIICVRSL